MRARCAYFDASRSCGTVFIAADAAAVMPLTYLIEVIAVRACRERERRSFRNGHERGRSVLLRDQHVRQPRDGPQSYGTWNTVGAGGRSLGPVFRRLRLCARL